MDEAKKQSIAVRDLWGAAPRLRAEDSPPSMEQKEKCGKRKPGSIHERCSKPLNQILKSCEISICAALFVVPCPAVCPISIYEQRGLRICDGERTATVNKANGEQKANGAAALQIPRLLGISEVEQSRSEERKVERRRVGGGIAKTRPFKKPRARAKQIR